MTNAQRQPTVSATKGTARPASSVASGTPDCFAAYAMPWRCVGNCAAINAFAAGCPRPLANPAKNIANASIHGAGLRAAMINAAAAVNEAMRRQLRIPHWPTRRPNGALEIIEPRAKAETRTAVEAAGMPKSRPICTPITPVRNGGSTHSRFTATAATTTRMSTRIFES